LASAVLVYSLSASDTDAADAQKRPIARVRVQLDAERNRVWLLTGEGLAIYDSTAPNRLVRVPIPGWRVAGEPFGCLPDLALGPNGEAVVSSDVVPALWRVDSKTLAVTRHELRLDADTDKDVGFTVLRYLPARRQYLAVNGPHGTIWLIDRELKNAHRMLRQVPRENDCGARAAALVRQFGLLN
jgi:hypothetical protein